MGENEFSVVYTGRIVDGEHIDNVKKRLSAMFKQPEPVIDRLLNSRGSVIKKGLDQKTAEKYCRKIEKTGAVCRIKPARPAREMAPPEPVIESAPESAPDTSPPEPEKRVETRVVVVPLNRKGEDRFSPQQADGIGGADKGLVIRMSENKTVAYSAIKAIAAFERDESNGGAVSFLIFTASEARPFVCDMENIAYADFPIKVFPKSIASFRGFLHFICRENPLVILEEATFDFLSGSTPQKLNENSILKLSTGMAQLIASGEAESHT